MQICHRVFYFLAVIETQASDYPVGYAAADKGLLDKVRLRVHSVKHSVVVPLAAICNIRHDRIGDITALAYLVLCDVEFDLCALSVVRPEAFALSLLVIRDNGVGGVEYGLRRAVILLKADHSCVLILLFKAQYIFNRRAAEAVYALIVVADDADIFVPRCEQSREHILGVVRVLILIHHYVLEAVLIIFAGLRARSEQFYRIDDQVVKIHGIRLFQKALVFGIDIADLFKTDIGSARRDKFLRRDELVLSAAYLGEHGLDRDHFFVITQTLDALLSGAL